jgi:hypothetical protein
MTTKTYRVSMLSLLVLAAILSVAFVFLLQMHASPYREHNGRATTCCRSTQCA